MAIQDSRITQLDSQVNLTTRQKRRADRATTLENGKSQARVRGKTMGYKYGHVKERPYAQITDEMRRVVGLNAANFICKCSVWTKEFCPLSTKSWYRMDKACKERLFNKIKEKFNLPPIVDNEDVDTTLDLQCSKLYNGLRYRIKEDNFTGLSKEAALAKTPKYIEPETWIWLVNFWSTPEQMALLHFIYWDDLPELHELTGLNSKGASTLMAQHMLSAADRYGLERLKLLCEAKLREDVAINTVATTLALADQHHCSQLKFDCLKFIALHENLRAVLQTDGFEYLKASCPLIISELLDYVARIRKHSESSLLHRDETNMLAGSDLNGRRVKQRLY